MISEEIYSKCRPLSELTSKLRLPKLIKIPRGLSKRDRKLMYRLQAENRKYKKLRKELLDRYKIGNYHDHDKDGYGKIPVYLFEGVYYS